MKAQERMLRVALIFLILLSVYFTYTIWISPAGKIPNVDPKQVLKNSQNHLRADDAFLPLRGVWDMDGKNYQTNSENVISEAQTRLAGSTYGTLKLAAENDSFDKYTRIEKGVELYYEGVFSLSEYIKIFEVPLKIEEIKNADTFVFSKIQVDFSNRTIRFLNFDKKQVYEAPITTDAAKLEAIYTNNPTRFVTMAPDNQLLPRLLQTKETIRLKKYSYILTTQAYSLFKNAFFQRPEQAKGEEEENGARSFRSGNEEIVVDEQKRSVQFTGGLSAELQKENIYNQSFNYVSHLGTTVGNLHYFDRQKEQINYRVFVEGYPIFSQSTKGRVTVNVGTSSNSKRDQVKIATSMDTVQVPIPSEEKIELPGSFEMLRHFSAAGFDLKKVQSYIVGYTWQDVDGVNKLVNLTPEWYIKYQDVWYSVDDLINGTVELEAS